MNTVVIVLSAAIVIMGVEKWRPARSLPRVRGWYLRALCLNALQGAAALLTANTFDVWFADANLLTISTLPVIPQALIAYFAITFVYYWWHRARHQIDPLWRWLHQTHHSPSRIEIITSFYKHPLEVMMNGALSSAIVFLLLGVDAQAATIAVMITGLAELFYHMNIATPTWLGYCFQRPEMHRVHHQRGRHRDNYSDLPLWDMLFGTFNNPTTSPDRVGFPQAGETKIIKLLLGRRLPS